MAADHDTVQVGAVLTTRTELAVCPFEVMPGDMIRDGGRQREVTAVSSEMGERRLWTTIQLKPIGGDARNEIFMPDTELISVWRLLLTPSEREA